MNNQWTLKKKRDVWKAYMMILAMVLFLFSPAFSLNSDYTVFADDNDTEENGDGLGSGNDDGNENESEDPDDEDEGDSDSNGDEEDSPEPEDGNESGDDGNENESGSDDNEESGQEADIPDTVYPHIPDITDAKCNADGTVSNPEIHTDSLGNPVDMGIKYAFTDLDGNSLDLENIAPGQIVKVIAAPYNSDFEMEYRDPWIDNGDGTVAMDITFSDPDCEAENEEGPQKVTPITPEVVEAICEDGTVTQPYIDIEQFGNPVDTGILYSFFYGEETTPVDLEDLAPGDTIDIMASLMDDEEFVFDLSSDWVDAGDGFAKLAITLDDPDCDGEDPENGEGSDDHPVLTPIDPAVTQATCDADGKMTKPSVDTDHHGAPVDTGILYDFVGDIGPENMEAGDTVRVVAAPYDREDEGIELEIPEGWTEVNDGWAEFVIELEVPNCDDEETGEADTDSDPVAEEIITVDRDGCIVSIKTLLNEGEYTLQVWDDGMKVDEVTKKVSEQGEHVFTWEITEPAMEGAPGVGFVLIDENGSEVDMLDPYEYPAEVADKCGGVTPDSDEDEIMGQGGPGDEMMGKGGPEVLTSKTIDESEVVEGETLPDTATPLFNILMIGFALFSLGGLSLLLFRMRKA